MTDMTDEETPVFAEEDPDPIHGLFANTEKAPRASRIARICLQRYQDGAWKTIPKEYSAGDLRDWTTVAAAFGGGRYKAFCYGPNGKVLTTTVIDLAGKSRPLFVTPSPESGTPGAGPAAGEVLPWVAPVAGLITGIGGLVMTYMQHSSQQQEARARAEREEREERRRSEREEREEREQRAIERERRWEKEREEARQRERERERDEQSRRDREQAAREQAAREQAARERDLLLQAMKQAPAGGGTVENINSVVQLLDGLNLLNRPLDFGKLIEEHKEPFKLLTNGIAHMVVAKTGGGQPPPIPPIGQA